VAVFIVSWSTMVITRSTITPAAERPLLNIVILNTTILCLYQFIGVLMGIFIAHANLREAQDKANDQHQQVLLDNNYTPFTTV
jgi:hypothetical protein